MVWFPEYPYNSKGFSARFHILQSFHINENSIRDCDTQKGEEGSDENEDEEDYSDNYNDDSWNECDNGDY